MSRTKRVNKSKFRSGLEDKVIQDLKNRKVKFEYENIKIKYQKKPSIYTPDIQLSNGIIVEVKGYFDAEDRSKHLLIKAQHPEIDLRFVFQSANKKIHAKSTTTYADWCDKHGFLWADKLIPEEWIKEKK
ncbi:MAG: endonuclease I [Chitinophaga sp.]|nr:endonuclease I [Chitinophaga sp.]